MTTVLLSTYMRPICLSVSHGIVSFTHLDNLVLFLSSLDRQEEAQKAKNPAGTHRARNDDQTLFQAVELLH